MCCYMGIKQELVMSCIDNGGTASILGNVNDNCDLLQCFDRPRMWGQFEHGMEFKLEHDLNTMCSYLKHDGLGTW